MRNFPVSPRLVFLGRLTVAIWSVLLIFTLVYRRLHHASPTVTAVAPTQAASAYTVQEITLTGQNFLWTYGLNDQGAVVGTTGIDTWRQRPFVWQNGKGHYLHLPDRAVAGEAYAIDNQGRIAGSLEINEKDSRDSMATLWSERSCIAFRGKQMRSPRLTAIHAGTAPIGWYQDRDRKLHSFRWKIDGGTIEELGSYAAFSVNQNGEIAGTTFNPDASGWDVNAVVQRSGTLIRLPSPKCSDKRIDNQDERDRSGAYSINSGGIVAGYYFTKEGTSYAIVWGADNRILFQGAADTGAIAINDAGQVGGWAGPSCATSATLWGKGQMISLAKYLPGDRTWRWSVATAINNRGQVLMVAVRAGETKGVHSFLLTPKP